MRLSVSPLARWRRAIGRFCAAPQLLTWRCTATASKDPNHLRRLVKCRARVRVWWAGERRWYGGVAYRLLGVTKGKEQRELGVEFDDGDRGVYAVLRGATCGHILLENEPVPDFFSPEEPPVEEAEAAPAAPPDSESVQGVVAALLAHAQASAVGGVPTTAADATSAPVKVPAPPAAVASVPAEPPAAAASVPTVPPAVVASLPTLPPAAFAAMHAVPPAAFAPATAPLPLGFPPLPAVVALGAGTLPDAPSRVPVGTGMLSIPAGQTPEDFASSHTAESFDLWLMQQKTAMSELLRAQNMSPLEITEQMILMQEQGNSLRQYVKRS